MALLVLAKHHPKANARFTVASIAELVKTKQFSLAVLSKNGAILTQKSGDCECTRRQNA
jgi:hypothetical protein